MEDMKFQAIQNEDATFVAWGPFALHECHGMDGMCDADDTTC